MKVVILGGLGFVGLHLTKRLADEHEVIIFDPHEPTAEESIFLSERSFMHFLTDNWMRRFERGKIAHDADVVVSLPGLLGSVPSVENLTGNLHHSVFPHVMLLKTLITCELSPLVVFPSSDLAYCYPPRCMYAANKLYVEDMLRVAHRIYGIPYVALRMATGYGPMQRRESVVNLYVRLGLEGKKIPFWGDGLNRQAFIYADDMARAFVRACEGRFPTGTYPLVGHNSRIWDIADTVSRLVGGKVVHKPFPELAEKVNVGDLPIYGNPPKFKPRVGLEEGIKRTARWMESR